MYLYTQSVLRQLGVRQCLFVQVIKMGIFTLSNVLQDDQASVAFLQQRGIIHNPRQCTNGLAMAIQYRNTGSDRWRCHIRGCWEKVGVKKGTWLEQSKLPYRTVPLFIYSWACEMTSFEFCERELHMNKNTVVDWNNYLREVCAMDLLQNRVQIGGPNMTVEVDESLFARRKNHQGRVFTTTVGFWQDMSRDP